MRAAIIPAYNPPEMEAFISEVARYVDRVIVVDDGSDTPVSSSGCELLTHSENHGKGAAIRTGLAHLAQDAPLSVVFIDADCEHDPAEIPRLLDALDQADLVLGYRDVHRSFRRRVVNAWMAFWFRLVHPAVRDPSCGFRALRWDLVEKLELGSDDFCIDAETILEAVKQEARITSVPISARPRSSSYVTRRDFIRINNFFDRWVLENRHNLHLVGFRRAMLLAGVTIGHSCGRRCLA